MSKYKAKSAEKILAPEGVHNTRVVRICELGTQETEFGEKFKVQLSFELVDESAVFNEDKGEQNFVVHKTYNRSLHKRADLAKDLKKITGLDFEGDDEFEMDDLLNKPCQVEIEHTEDGQYANITNIMAVKKGDKVAKAESDLKSLYLDENFDEDVFDSLHDGLKEKIEASKEYQEIMENQKPKKGSAKKKGRDEDEDEKPKRKGSRKDEDEDEDEEDEKPAKKKQSAKKPMKKATRRG